MWSEADVGQLLSLRAHTPCPGAGVASPGKADPQPTNPGTGRDRPTVPAPRGHVVTMEIFVVVAGGPPETTGWARRADSTPQCLGRCTVQCSPSALRGGDSSCVSPMSARAQLPPLSGTPSHLGAGWGHWGHGVPMESLGGLPHPPELLQPGPRVLGREPGSQWAPREPLPPVQDLGTGRGESACAPAVPPPLVRRDTEAAVGSCQAHKVLCGHNTTAPLTLNCCDAP